MDLAQQAKEIEQCVNEALAKLDPFQGPDQTIAELVPEGWEYVTATQVGGPHQIVITRYNP